MNYTFKSNLTQSEFDGFAQVHPYGTFFQSSQWAGVKDNWTPLYTGVYEDGVLVAAALVLKRSLVLKYSFMYAPRGPLLDFDNKQLLNYYLEKLKLLAKEHSAISLTLDPYVKRASYSMAAAMNQDLDINYDDSLVEDLSKHNFIRRKLGLELHDTIQPRFQPTIYFDSEQSHVETRGYKNGLKAKDNNVKIKRVSLEGLGQFVETIEKTEDYKNIKLRGEDYFKKIINEYQDKCLVSIAYLDLNAEFNILKERIVDMEKRLENKNMREARRRDYEKKLKHFKKNVEFVEKQQTIYGDTVNIAGMLVLRNKTKAELVYAGMDREFQKYFGSNLNYVDAINWAQESGCESVCFGGSTGHFKDGISRFKVSFNPTLDEYIGEFVYENKKFMNFVFEKLLQLKEKISYQPTQ